MPALHVYACAQDGLTALHWAVQPGHLECLKELLAKGADVDQATKVSGACCSSPALCCRSPKPACMLALPDCACAQNGDTALQLAAQHGWPECMRKLLARGAAVDHADHVSGALVLPFGDWIQE
jgi:ankyrin repeat protein